MGRFIAIEGGDGSGKATQSKLLAEQLTKQGYDVFQIAFPRYGEESAYYVERYLNGAYGGPNDVPAELGTLPYALDRFAAKSDILAHLEKENSVVIADRYMASNLAHQGTKVADKIERATFYERTKLTEYSILGIPMPDANIVLIVPTEHMQANVDKKDARSYTDKKRDIHEADANHLDLAKAGFEELCQLFPEEFTKIECIEDGLLRPIDQIQSSIRTVFFETG